MKRNDLLFLLLTTILVFITRWNLILDHKTLLDGDESLLAIMTGSWLKGEEFGLYFYGQRYGFVFLEIITTLITAKLFGLNENTIHFTALLVWIAGLWYFYKLLILVNPNRTLRILSLLLLVSLPVWVLWSFKFRNGYYLGFSLCSVFLYYLFKTDRDSSTSQLRFAFLGILVTLLVQVQVLWFIPCVPFIVFFLRTWDKKHKLTFLLTTGISTLLLGVYQLSLSNFWKTQSAFDWSSKYDNLINLPVYLFHHFTATFYLQQYYPPKTIALITATVITTFVLIIILIRAFGFTKDKTTRHGYWAVVLSLLFPAFIDGLSYRYYLPLSLFLLLYLNIRWQKSKSFYIGAYVIVILLGFLTTFYNPYKTENDRFKFYSNYSKSDILELVDYLEQNDIHYCISLHNLAQWHISFYSGKNVTVRSVLNEGRVMKNIEEVNRAYLNHEKTALIIFNNQQKETLRNYPLQRINGNVSVLVNPSTKVLHKMDVEMP